jgi:hypothetical protein
MKEVGSLLVLNRDLIRVRHPPSYNAAKATIPLLHCSSSRATQIPGPKPQPVVGVKILMKSDTGELSQNLSGF